MLSSGAKKLPTAAQYLLTNIQVARYNVIVAPSICQYVSEHHNDQNSYIEPGTHASNTEGRRGTGPRRLTWLFFSIRRLQEHLTDKPAPSEIWWGGGPEIEVFFNFFKGLHAWKLLTWPDWPQQINFIEEDSETLYDRNWKFDLKTSNPRTVPHLRQLHLTVTLKC